MLIRTKLLISILVSFVGILILVSFVALAVNNIYKVSEQRDRTTFVIKSVFELNILTNDYLLHGEERAQIQWRQKYKTLQTQLLNINSHNKIDQEIIGDIKNINQVLGEKFTDLENSRSLSILGENGRRTSLEKRLVGQIGVESQRLVSQAFQLLSVIESEINRMITRAYVFGFILIIVLVGVIIFLSLLFYESVVKPIGKLHKSIERIARGEYTERLHMGKKSEIGNLADAFDDMAEELEKKEVALFEKNKELVASQQDLEEQSDAVLNVLEDIEIEKKKTEDLAQNLAKFKLAVDSATEQIIITDVAGVVLYANGATEKISGYKPEEVIGRRPRDLWRQSMTKADRQAMWQVIKKLDRTGFSKEIVCLHKKGKEYISETKVAPMRDEKHKLRFFIWIERDITQAKEIDRAKTEFVSLASHQLRTPLTAINWYLEMLISGETGKLNAKQDEYVGKAYKSNQRMTDLVGALLNVSRLELGTFIIEPKPADIKQIAKSIVVELKHEIENKKIKFRQSYAKDLPKKIKLDEKLIRIVIQNLLTNAIKYTPSKGRISLKITHNKKDLLINVKDTGYGIPQDEQGKIFTKLFRADNIRIVDPSGTGLGLYIVKTILDHSGGSVSFVSVENQGTEFFIHIPLTGMKAKQGTKTLD